MGGSLWTRFYCEGDRALSQVAQREGGVSILGGIQKPSGLGPGQLALGSPAWAGGFRPDDLQSSPPTLTFPDSINFHSWLHEKTAPRLSEALCMKTTGKRKTFLSQGHSTTTADPRYVPYSNKSNSLQKKQTLSWLKSYSVLPGLRTLWV